MSADFGYKGVAALICDVDTAGTRGPRLPQHGVGDRLDCALILFNNVVAIRAVTDYDCGAVLFLGARDSRCIGRLVMEGEYRANGLK